MTVNHSEAATYLAGLNKKTQPIAQLAHDLLVGLGCSSYVKTIYVGYDLDGVMVAALYGHVDYVEVALALEELYKSNILIDATHLTWRTLPVCAVLRTRTDVKEFIKLASVACGRVGTGVHHVDRDSEFFAKAKKERREKGVKPRK